MTRITEPHWGLPVGLVDAQGRVTISDQFANVLRALVKNLASTTAAATQAQATATATAATVSSEPSGADLLAAMYGTHGVQIFGSIASGVEIRGSDGSGNIGAHIAYGV